MFNSVILSGRLTASPELKQTNNGTSYCRFSIANETGYGDNKKTNFFNIVAFGKTAEFVKNYLDKGRMVGIQGELSQSAWVDQNGNNKSSIEVIARQVEFMDFKQNQQDQNAPAPTPTAEVDNFVSVPDSVSDDELPFI